MMGVLVLLGVVGIGVAIVIAIEESNQKRILEARQNYQRLLTELKRKPADADLRQYTLALGRTYCRLLREENKNTIFDEVALMNDINAACAATQQVVSPQPATADIEARFERLQGLKDKGLIDNEAYIQRKSELLAQV